MTDRAVFLLTFASALGSGLVAGIFYAFSTAVMRALGALAPAHGAAAMQSINVAVFNPLFMGALFGTAALCAIAAAASYFVWQEPGAKFLLAGSVVYLLGCIFVTGAFNVPLNNALAVAEPTTADGIALWTRYLVDWTWWNHVRTAACLAASALFIVALVSRASP